MAHQKIIFTHAATVHVHTITRFSELYRLYFRLILVYANHLAHRYHMFVLPRVLVYVTYKAVDCWIHLTCCVVLSYCYRICGCRFMCFLDSVVQQSTNKCCQLYPNPTLGYSHRKSIPQM